MANNTLAAVQKQMKENDPPIEVGQFWVAVNSTTGVVNRRIRILGRYLTDNKSILKESNMWIYQEHPGSMRTETGRIGVCPEFNLRYIFRLEF